MRSIILYGSQYGTTKRCAEKRSQLTKFPARSYEAPGDLSDCGLIVYLGGLYAGSEKEPRFFRRF